MSSALPQPMADSPEVPEPFSLKRWSRRKRAAAHGVPDGPIPAPATSVPAAAAAAASVPGSVAEAAPLPPVESLTFESDFSAFMQPKVAEDTKRAALRKLFSNPSFNVMDGLDIYVGDYTQADPMPAGMLEKLSAAYAMLDPVEPARKERADSPTPESAGDAAPAGASESRAVDDAETLAAPPVVAPEAEDATGEELKAASGTRKA